MSRLRCASVAIITRRGSATRYITVRVCEPQPLRTGLLRLDIGLWRCEYPAIGEVSIDAGESPEELGYQRGQTAWISHYRKQLASDVRARTCRPVDCDSAAQLAGVQLIADVRHA